MKIIIIICVMKNENISNNESNINKMIIIWKNNEKIIAK